MMMIAVGIMFHSWRRAFTMLRIGSVRFTLHKGHDSFSDCHTTSDHEYVKKVQKYNHITCD